MRTTVLSDGAWGTALALVLLNNGHEVSLWGPFPEYIEEMLASRRNSRFLPGIELPNSLTLTADLSAAVAATDLIVLAAPTQYLRGTLEKLKCQRIPASAIIVNVAKGIEIKALLRPGQMVAEVLGGVRYATLSGPSHAEEVARRLPAAVVVASAEQGVAKQVQGAFMNDAFRIYTSDDVVGVELGGALKNIFAVAAGISDGMSLGDNAKAALVTRAIVEMARLGKALGGKPETFAGLSGIGDLIVTCMSRHSRNRHVGEELGRGRTLEDIQTEMGMQVAEGVKTVHGARQLANEYGVDIPIVDEVYATLYENKPPAQALQALMTREPKPEA